MRLHPTARQCRHTVMASPAHHAHFSAAQTHQAQGRHSLIQCSLNSSSTSMGQAAQPPAFEGSVMRTRSVRAVIQHVGV